MSGQSHNYLAAVADDGTILPWNPNANREAVSLAVSGGTVFAGGAFNSVGGVARPTLAALSVATGAATPWNPNVTGGTVFALGKIGNRVYAGGSFHNVGGLTRHHLAAVDALTGAVITSWNPGPDSSVYA